MIFFVESWRSHFGVLTLMAIAFVLDLLNSPHKKAEKFTPKNVPFSASMKK